MTRILQGFSFFCKLGLFFETSLGLPHLNMKGKMILIVVILKESTYLKFPPNPRLCWRVCANISYLRMSLSLTDLRANFMASSKWSRLISGTGSSSSTSYIVTVPFVSHINEHMSNTGNNNNKWQVFTLTWQQQFKLRRGKGSLKGKVDCKTVGFFLKISKEIGKACPKSLALSFQPRSRPFVWLLARTWIHKNTDCFAV